MLAAKEEYLRISRTFLREFVRSLLRMDFDFSLFTSHLFNAATEDFSTFATPVNRPLFSRIAYLTFYAYVTFFPDSVSRGNSCFKKFFVRCHKQFILGFLF